MKDELNSIILEEYCGLRPKSYSLLFNGLVKDNILIHTNTSQKQAAKGTNKSVKEAHLRLKHFKDTFGKSRYCNRSTKCDNIQVTYYFLISSKQSFSNCL